LPLLLKLKPFKFLETVGVSANSPDMENTNTRKRREKKK